MVLALALQSVAPAGALAAQAPGPQQRPNVLFIAVDDLKPLTGAYGSAHALTPSLDRLAAEGVLFTSAYAQYPVCGPSRTSLLTGLRPETNGVLDLKTRMRDVRPDIVTLPQLFRQAGYETAASGKIFDPRNVDSRRDDDPASWSIPYAPPQPRADRENPGRLAVQSIDAPPEQFVDGDVNRRGIELLRRMASGDKPFFLAVGYKKPHLPFAAPKSFFDLYDPAAFDLAPFTGAPAGAEPTYILNDLNEMRSYHPTPPPGQAPVDYPPGVFTPVQQRELLQGYYAATSFIDSLLGSLLEVLEETGQAERTIVVLWGDHGFHLGDHGMWGKHTTMEQANRVPLIMRVPGRATGTASTPVELMDLYPTLAELAGLAPPEGLQGKSLVPVLDDPGADLGDVAISQYKRRGAYGYSMRTPRYRYTEWVDAEGRTVYRDLYDMVDDPGETVNLGADPAHAGLLDDMAALLRRNGAGLERLGDAGE